MLKYTDINYEDNHTLHWALISWINNQVDEKNDYL